MPRALLMAWSITVLFTCRYDPPSFGNPASAMIFSTLARVGSQDSLYRHTIVAVPCPLPLCPPPEPVPPPVHGLSSVGTHLGGSSAKALMVRPEMMAADAVSAAISVRNRFFERECIRLSFLTCVRGF
ncbi:hypothetical protein [Faecalicoccus pleomorphus]|uniref:hypothetical protein n=1 Tax=Faecalicoccus pleomorphus TaxID=1323 RepID=UPI0022E730F0|nr:hypothetical protein [Faecalicoccus pleomorphus]